VKRRERTEALLLTFQAKLTRNVSNFVAIRSDVRIYNYALTETQVKSLYNENSSVLFGPSEGTP